MTQLKDMQLSNNVVSTIDITNTLPSEGNVKVATIEINGISTDLYAPQGGESETQATILSLWATDVDYEVGDKPDADNPDISCRVRIPASMTQLLMYRENFYSTNPKISPEETVASSDTIIDWGDGTSQKLSETEFINYKYDKEYHTGDYVLVFGEFPQEGGSGNPGSELDIRYRGMSYSEKWSALATLAYGGEDGELSSKCLSSSYGQGKNNYGPTFMKIYKAKTDSQNIHPVFDDVNSLYWEFIAQVDESTQNNYFTEDAKYRNDKNYSNDIFFKDTIVKNPVDQKYYKCKKNLTNKFEHKFSETEYWEDIGDNTPYTLDKAPDFVAYGESGEAYEIGGEPTKCIVGITCQDLSSAYSEVFNYNIFLKHTYSTAGKYEVKITGSNTKMVFKNTTTLNKYNLMCGMSSIQNTVTNVLNLGSSKKIFTMSKADHCVALKATSTGSKFTLSAENYSGDEYLLTKSSR